LAVLSRQLSGINANNVLSRALRELRLTGTSLTAADVPRLTPAIERGLRLFLPMSAVTSAVGELTRAFASTQPPKPAQIAIVNEGDISDARMAARGMCELLGARRVVVQKVATVVSELARNIYMYTPGGTIDLVPGSSRVDGARPRLTVRAVDAGPGITNLDEILAGRYRSRTGLGAGLLGTKRLVDRFQITTGATGTRIEVEVDL